MTFRDRSLDDCGSGQAAARTRIENRFDRVQPRRSPSSRRRSVATSRSNTLLPQPCSLCRSRIILPIRQDKPISSRLEAVGGSSPTAQARVDQRTGGTHRQRTRSWARHRIGHSRRTLWWPERSRRPPPHSVSSSIREHGRNPSRPLSTFLTARALAGDRHRNPRRH